MKDGFVKIALAVPPLRVADCEFNIGEAIRLAHAAAEGGARRAVPRALRDRIQLLRPFFSHLHRSMPPRMRFPRFRGNRAQLNTLYFIGVPVRVAGKLYNCCAAVHRAAACTRAPRPRCPTITSYYETRQFTFFTPKTVEIEFAGQRCLFGTKILFDIQSCTSLSSVPRFARICGVKHRLPLCIVQRARL